MSVKIETICEFCGKNMYRELMLCYSHIEDNPSLDFRYPVENAFYLLNSVTECPSCGYIDRHIDLVRKDKTEIKNWMNSKSFLTCDGIPFTSTVAKRFYRLYVYYRDKNDTQNAFWAIQRTIWICEDEKDDIAIAKCIPIALSLLENLTKEEYYILIRVDLLRRTGQFEKVLTEYGKVSLQDTAYNKALSFQLTKAREKDTNKYTFDDVLDGKSLFLIQTEEKRRLYQPKILST